MSTRDVILAAVRKNRPQPAVALPELPKISRSGEPALSCFRRQLEEMGGKSFEVADAAAAREGGGAISDGSSRLFGGRRSARE
jgi:hypothetical protein